MIKLEHETEEPGKEEEMQKAMEKPGNISYLIVSVSLN